MRNKKIQVATGRNIGVNRGNTKKKPQKRERGVLKYHIPTAILNRPKQVKSWAVEEVYLRRGGGGVRGKKATRKGKGALK